MNALPPPRSLLLQSPQGAKVLLAKATYSLSEGRLELAGDLEPFVERDDRDSYGRILRPGDAIERPTPLVIVKGRVQPNGTSHALVARVRVGNADSSVEVPSERALEEVVLSLEMEELAAGASFSLEGLHPMRPIFATSLPWRVPVARLGRAGGVELRPLSLRLLFADVDRSLCTLTYSAVVLRAGEVPAELTLDWGSAEDRTQAPLTSPLDELERTTTAVIDLPSEPTTANLPKKRATLEVATKSSRALAALPFVDSSPPPRAPSVPPPPAGPAKSSVAPPRPVPRETRTVGQLAAGPLEANPSAREAGAYRSVAPPPRELPRADPRELELQEAARRGAGAASDEAARAAARPATPSAPPQSAVVKGEPREEKIRLLFWDDTRLDNILDQPRWRALARPAPAVPPPAPPKRGEAPAPPAEPESDEARRNRKLESLHTLLSRGELDKDPRALANLSSDPNGAPMALLRGTLELPLNEMELLKATCAAAQPSAKTDKRLKELLDATEELLPLPLAASTDYVLQLLGQIRESWAKANRSLPQTFLVANVERALLEKRSHTKRNVLGAEHVRGFLRLQNAAIPCYVPSDALPKLPLMLAIAVHVVVEVHPAQDPLDPGDACLRTLAIARLLNGTQVAP